jgi:hypothetical protein
MTRTGRPPKPIEQKVKLGNPGKRALPEPKIQLLPSLYEVPQPSRPLSKYGMELWERIWSAGSVWLNPETDFELFQITCEMVDEYINLRSRVIRDNRMDERKALRVLEKNITANLSLLGFSPTDRSRLGIQQMKAQTRLEEMRSRANKA